MVPSGEELWVCKETGQEGTVDFQNSSGANIWATLVCIHCSSLYGNWSHLTFFASPQSVSLFCSDDTMWPWWHLRVNEVPCLSHSKRNMGDFHIMTFLPIKLHLSLLHSSCPKQTHQFVSKCECEIKMSCSPVFGLLCWSRTVTD